MLPWLAVALAVALVIGGATVYFWLSTPQVAACCQFGGGGGGTEVDIGSGSVYYASSSDTWVAETIENLGRTSVTLTGGRTYASGSTQQLPRLDVGFGPYTNPKPTWQLPTLPPPTPETMTGHVTLQPGDMVWMLVEIRLAKGCIMPLVDGGKHEYAAYGIPAVVVSARSLHRTSRIDVPLLESLGYRLRPSC